MSPSPRPRVPYLMSLPQVPSLHTRVPMSPSPCPRPTFTHSRLQSAVCSLQISYTDAHGVDCATSYIKNKIVKFQLCSDAYNPSSTSDLTYMYNLLNWILLSRVSYQAPFSKKTNVTEYPVQRKRERAFQHQNF